MSNSRDIKFMLTKGAFIYENTFSVIKIQGKFDKMIGFTLFFVSDLKKNEFLSCPIKFDIIYVK